MPRFQERFTFLLEAYCRAEVSPPSREAVREDADSRNSSGSERISLTDIVSERNSLRIRREFCFFSSSVCHKSMGQSCVCTAQRSPRGVSPSGIEMRTAAAVVRAGPERTLPELVFEPASRSLAPEIVINPILRNQSDTLNSPAKNPRQHFRSGRASETPDIVVLT